MLGPRARRPRIYKYLWLLLHRRHAPFSSPPIPSALFQSTLSLCTVPLSIYAVRSILLLCKTCTPSLVLGRNLRHLPSLGCQTIPYMRYSNCYAAGFAFRESRMTYLTTHYPRLVFLQYTTSVCCLNEHPCTICRERKRAMLRPSSRGSPTSPCGHSPSSYLLSAPGGAHSQLAHLVSGASFE